MFAYVPTGSMTGTLNIGDIAFVSKIVGEPTYGDIIVFKFETDDTLYVKRVVGLPEDTIKIEGTQLYRNGELIEEPYLYTNSKPWSVETLTLKDNQYFLMGDNRDDSFDSRGWGPITLEKGTYIGKVLFKLFPPGKLK
jgi:signal peptidase I